MADQLSLNLKHLVSASIFHALIIKQVNFVRRWKLLRPQPGQVTVLLVTMTEWIPLKPKFTCFIDVFSKKKLFQFFTIFSQLTLAPANLLSENTQGTQNTQFIFAGNPMRIQDPSRAGMRASCNSGKNKFELMSFSDKKVELTLFSSKRKVVKAVTINEVIN